MILGRVILFYRVDNWDDPSIPASHHSGIWRFCGFFRVPFRDRGTNSAGFVYAKHGLGQRPAAASALETDYAQKPETQTIPSQALSRDVRVKKMC